MVPEKKLGVIVLTNSDDGNPLLYLNKTFEIVEPAITEATEPPKVTPEFDPEWERYVGTYGWKNSEIEIKILNGKLIMIEPEEDNPWESRVILEPLSKNSFKAVPAQWKYSLNGEVLTFELDATGNIKRFGSPNFYWIRK